MTFGKKCAKICGFSQKHIENVKNIWYNKRKTFIIPLCPRMEQIEYLLHAVMDNYTNANFARHQKSGALMYEIFKNRNGNAEFAFKMPKSNLRR